MSTFTMIAKNVARYYTHIKSAHPELYESEEQLLALTGIVDAWVYIQKDQLRVKEIAWAAHHSEFNGILMIPHSVDLYDGLDGFGKPINRLLNFTLTLEALIFREDTRVDGREILLAVKKMRPKIERAINKACAKPVPGMSSSFADKVLTEADIDGVKATLADIVRRQST